MIEFANLKKKYVTFLNKITTMYVSMKIMNIFVKLPQ